MIKSFFHLFTLVLVTVLAFTVEVRFDSIPERGVIYVDVGVNNTYAADPVDCTVAANASNPSCAGKTQESVWIKNAVDALNAILGFMTFLITPLIALAGWLLSPDWTRGDLFGLNQGLYKIWILVSNITYFLYALGLIGIALATIFNQDNYAYKTMLPRFALGIIMVPFTWWIVQFVLSVSNVLAVSVMQIPADTLQSLSKTATTGSWYKDETIPKEVTYINNGGNGKNNEQLLQNPISCYSDSTKTKPKNDKSCLSPEQILTNASSGPYSMLTLYAYSVFKIQDYKQIDGISKNITQILQVFNKLIFGALIYLIFGLLIFALVFALLARAFELWIVTMFSPLLSLSISLPDSMKKGGIFEEHLSFKNLISLAMIPVYVSAALSFGLLFLGLLMNGDTPAGNVAVIENGKGIKLFGSDDSTLSIIAEQGDSGDAGSLKSTFKLGDFKLTHIGTITNQEALDISESTGFFNGSGGMIGTIILDIIGLTLLWLALMGALKASKITSGAIEPFEKAGKTIGELGKSLPKYTPIPGLGMSASGLEKTATMAKNTVDTMHNAHDEASILRKFPSLGTGHVKAEDIQALRVSIDNMNASNPQSRESTLKKAGDTIGPNATAQQLAILSDSLKTMFNKMGEVEFRNELIKKGITDSVDQKKIIDLFKGELKGSDSEKAWRLFGAKFSSGGAGANQTPTVSVGDKNEIKDQELIKKGYKFEMTLKTPTGTRTVYFGKDGKIDFNEELADFVDLYKGRTSNETELMKLLETELKGKVDKNDISTLKDKLNAEKDIYKKGGDSTTPPTSN